MMKILITGGKGDLAVKVKSLIKDDYIVSMPTKDILDVTSIESVENFFCDKAFDIIINNAGTLYSSLIIDSEPEKWIRDINVNLIGTYLVSKYGIDANSKTKIINISSTAAFNSYKDWTSYCASKAGVIKLSLGLASDGYDVITLCPGAIDTKLRKNINIVNHNVMTLTEGAVPIIDAIKNKYSSGDIIFYRKNILEIKRSF